MGGWECHRALSAFQMRKVPTSALMRPHFKCDLFLRFQIRKLTQGLFCGEVALIGRPHNFRMGPLIQGCGSLHLGGGV